MVVPPYTGRRQTPCTAIGDSEPRSARCGGAKEYTDDHATARVVEKRGELEGLLQETVTKVLDDMGLLVNKLSKPGVPSLG